MEKGGGRTEGWLEEKEEEGGGREGARRRAVGWPRRRHVMPAPPGLSRRSTEGTSPGRRAELRGR